MRDLSSVLPTASISASTELNSQDVGDDPDTPQIGRRRDRLVAGDLWRTELGRRVLDVQLPVRVVRARETQVGNLQFVRRVTQQ